MQDAIKDMQRSVGDKAISTFKHRLLSAIFVISEHSLKGQTDLVQWRQSLSVTQQAPGGKGRYGRGSHTDAYQV